MNKPVCSATAVTARAVTGSGLRSAGVRDVSAAMQTVTDGRNAMPSFRSSFAPEQIRDVGAYVVQAFGASR